MQDPVSSRPPMLTSTTRSNFATYAEKRRGLTVRYLYHIQKHSSHSASDPEDPPRTWTHPCKCTLVAHESCLLQWIQTSQANPSRADNALKCPQCGSTYELESDNPFVLRVLDSANKALSVMGRVVTVTSVSAIAATFGTGKVVVPIIFFSATEQYFF